MSENQPRLAVLRREVKGCVDRLVAVAGAVGRPELADALVKASERWSDRETTLVVLGEPETGRTTIVNALAGTLEPPLLPIGGEVVAVRAGTPGQLIIHEPGKEPDVRPLGEPGRAPPGATVEVLLPEFPVGADLVLVDAPPVGGRNDQRRMDAILDVADAVVLVTTAEAPLSRPELDVLVAARRRSGAALLVVTGVDRHHAWRTVVEESKRSIERRDPALLSAPPVAFAAPLAADAEVAARLGKDSAQALAEESGLAALRSRVREAILVRSREVRLLRLVEMADALAEELKSCIASVEIHQSAPDSAEADARTGLKVAREMLPLATARLYDEHTILRDSVNMAAGLETTAILDDVEVLLTGHSDIDDVIAGVEKSLEAARVRLDSWVRSQSEALARVARDGGAERGTREGLDEDGVKARRRPARSPRRKSVKDLMRVRLVLTLFSTTAGAALIVTGLTDPSGLVGEVRSSLMGLGMLIGGIGGTLAVREARRQRSIQESRAVIRSILEQWRLEYLVHVRAQLIHEQRAQRSTLKTQCDAQLNSAESQLAAVQQSVNVAAEERRRRSKELAENGKTLVAVRTSLSELRRILTP